MIEISVYICEDCRQQRNKKRTISETI